VPNEFRAVPSDVGERSLLSDRTYTPGVSDGLGSRRVAHGRPGEPLLDVLEFAPVIADAPGFERALRTRVDALRDISPFSIAAVHGVERPFGLGLCLVTEHVPGRRLAELPSTDLGGALAVGVIRTVTSVLEDSNQTGVGVAHGAISPGRILVKDDGSLIVLEHVLGWALESLKYSRAQLNGIGLVAPEGNPVRFDGRLDMIQLGFLALSVWLRRPLDLADFPDKATELLNEAAAHEDSPEFAERLRTWLERALQIGSRPFTSVQDAIEALDDLPADAHVVDTEAEAGLLAFHSEPPSQSKSAGAAEDGAFNVSQLRAAIQQRHATADAPAVPAPRFTRQAIWILAALAVIAIGEAVVLGLLAFRQRPAPASVSVIEPGEAPPSDSADPSTTAGTEIVNDIAAPPDGTGRASSAAIGPRLLSGRFGGLTISSALDFLVSADGKPIGSRGAPIALQEGAHRLEFVNDAVGFRQTQTVNVTYGQMTVLRVPMPTGRISVNASPWAEVVIDGAVVGETPIANYSLPVGPHQIVFRHPELGERRQTVVVKVGEYVRVTQAFDRSPEQK